MHRRTPFTTFAVAALAAVLTALAVPAQAINSYNARPAPERTEVGAFLALYSTDSGNVFDWVCSGTMISRDVYLTAAHCETDWPAGVRFYVSLDEDVQGELDQAHALGLSGTAEADWMVAHGHAVEGTGHYDPAYGHDESNPHDVAVVDFRGRAVTPADVWTFTPATLPSAGQLDAIGSRGLDKDTWTTVGYGTQEADNAVHGKPTHPGGGTREEATVGFNALTKSWVKLAMNESRGFGGACYGDSGGPNFVTVGGRLILAATTVSGDAQCYATNVAYRMDTPTARTFLGQFVTLP